MLSGAKLDLYADLPIECRRVMPGTDRTHLDALFTALETRFGSTRDYLLHRGLPGDAVAAITGVMIGPAAQQEDATSASAVTGEKPGHFRFTNGCARNLLG